MYSITLGNNDFAVCDISPDSTLLGTTDTMRSPFAKSSPFFLSNLGFWGDF